MTAIEEMAGMDVLCSDKTGTLTLNKLSVDKNLIEVYPRANFQFTFAGCHCGSPDLLKFFAFVDFCPF